MSLLEESRSIVPAPAVPVTGRLRDELRALLALAGPVALAEIGWMSMGIVDTLMVGPLGPQAIGAVGVGSGLFSAAAFFGMGLLLGLDTLVSQAFGARRIDECHSWLIHGVTLASLLAIPIAVLIWAISHSLDLAGLHPEVAPLASSYIGILDLGLLPLLLYAACRRYLQAVGFVGPITFALVSANLVNAFANWLLIYGKLGMPALGTDGSAWATSVSRVYLASVLGAAVLWHDRRHQGGLRLASRHLDPARLRRLLALGGPAAMQLLLEIGVFAAATTLAGRLTPVAVAAHQIALNIAALTFMVPYGVSSAAAVLVGQTIGRRDPRGARRAGWLALALGATFMSAVAVVLFAAPAWLMGLFTTDGVVIGIGVTLLGVAAIFQLFDGLQTVATGVLRGAGDTRTPMISNFIAHWAIGLPIGYWCCFVAGWGVVGLWIGLSLGLILCGTALVGVWVRTTRDLLPAVSFPA
jgi:multidrug resistance protein, MATE family